MHDDTPVVPAGLLYMIVSTLPTGHPHQLLWQLQGELQKILFYCANDNKQAFPAEAAGLESSTRC